MESALLAESDLKSRVFGPSPWGTQSLNKDSRFRIPRVRQRSQNRPRLKKSKRSLRGSLLGNGRNTVSRVLFRRRGLTEPHWVLGQTRWVLRKTRWVRIYTQIIDWEELTEFAPRNSVSPKKLTEFGVWNRTPRNRIRPVSDLRRSRRAPQKESKTSLQETLRVKTHLFFDSGDSFFWLFLGRPPGPPETPSETPFWLFEPGPVLTPLPDPWDPKSQDLPPAFSNSQARPKKSREPPINLVAQHCDPPYRARGYSYTYRIYVFQGIAGYRAIPPQRGGIAQLCWCFESTVGGYRRSRRLSPL